MKELNAVTLKNSLWETLNNIKNGELEASKGDAIASQAREIIRTVGVQIKIIDKAKSEMTSELKEFAMPKELKE